MHFVSVYVFGCPVAKRSLFSFTVPFCISRKNWEAGQGKGARTVNRRRIVRRHIGCRCDNEPPKFRTVLSEVVDVQSGSDVLTELLPPLGGQI